MIVTRIEWLDTKTVTEGGWCDIYSLQGMGLAVVETAGFIYDETDDYVTVILCHSEGDTSMGGIVIPKVMIQSRKDYKG